MLKKKWHYIFILIACVCNGLSLNAYEVVFKGVDDPLIIEQLNAVSELVSLADSPPSTLPALKRRAENDVPNLIKALHGLAYFNAHVDFQIDFDHDPGLVIVNVDSGPVYLFKDFQILNSECSSDKEYPLDYNSFMLQDLGIELDTPALPSKIINAEDALLQILDEMGRPLATIDKREVLADQATKTVTVNLYITSGPLAFFGTTAITGQCKVKEAFFLKKITWEEGAIYNPELVKRTLSSLEGSGLFSTITITHADKVEECNVLPMNIQVDESRHRSVGAGLSYNTDLGVGVMGEWEHRNIRGMGEKISLKANLWQIKQEARFLYVKPDFLRQNQDLLLQTELEHEKVKAYRESSMSVSGTLERRISDHLRLSYGVAYEYLRTTHSENNREFQLVKAPFQLLWNKTNSLLDPTWGKTIHFKLIPSYQAAWPTFAYMVNVLTITSYMPLDSCHRFVLAGKATIGSIWGSSKHSIPPSERFYAGSDNLLRGYRYLTIGPLSRGNCGKPIGGRSLMVYSLEGRYHATDSFGFVVFWDIGNAYNQTWPQFKHRQYQSTGLGFRYYTPIGPLRLDVAFPLNRRHHLDSFFQVYVSIGQAF